ncbi:MAG: ROK family protein [Lawsonella sp.]
MADKLGQDAPRGFGIDVGGSGIKGAIVNLETGLLIGERIRIDTPQPATPEAVADVIAEITRAFEWDGPVGVTLPSVIQQQIVKTAANIDKSWIGVNANELFSKCLPNQEVAIVNDADAAGIAELKYGAAKDTDGLVVLLTFGTGIGSAVMYKGILVPNTEFGHFELKGSDSEHHAAAAVRIDEDLSWEEWTNRVQDMIRGMENFFWPELIIAGGGISRKHKKWMPNLDIRTPIVPAELRNHAGIVGAAYAVNNNIIP